MSAQSIDFADVATRANLRSLIEAELGPPDRGRKWRCPFHDDHNPSFGVTPDGKRFRCWSGRCGVKGSALDWVMLRENLTVVEAARKLDPALAPRPGDRPKAKTAPAKPPASRTFTPRLAPAPAAWRDEAWQEAADALIVEAEASLWSECGRAARVWLHGRGLDDMTLRRFRLGFSPGWSESVPLEALADKEGPKPILVPRGIVIPRARPGSWYATSPDPGGEVAGPRWVGANVRRLMPVVDEPMPKGRKCMAFLGSARGYA